MGRAAAPPALPLALEGLEPEALWRNFALLSSIPRPSGGEARVLAALKTWAEERGLPWQQDEAGNLVVRRPGGGGGEAAPPVILQGHVDMVVTEKNDGTEHDFNADPIHLLRDGDWLTADGTTLGADNGIGVAAALAILEAPPTAKLPPIEVLFTVDEERGLSGARRLDGSLLKGRVMLNLDTEIWGEVFIGCAGCGGSVLTLDLPTELVADGSAGLALRVGGLMGGHSGINIHEDRGNAVRLTAALAEAVLAAVPGAALASIAGGDKPNAIPRECSATLVVPKAALADAALVAGKRGAELRREYGDKETGLTVTTSAVAPPAVALTAEGTQRLMDLLLLLPLGVWKKSHAMEGESSFLMGLVETSSNLSSVKVSPDCPSRFRIQTRTRSSLPPALEQIQRQIKRIGRLCGAEERCAVASSRRVEAGRRADDASPDPRPLTEQMELDEAYPGWAPNPSSEIVGITAAAIAEVIGHQPVLKAIHAGEGAAADEKRRSRGQGHGRRGGRVRAGASGAGRIGCVRLECGVIGEKVPGTQSVSYGPTITGAHSPDERIRISTVEPFFRATVKVLEALAARRA
eukprot:scaffold7.g3745.t1